VIVGGGVSVAVGEGEGVGVETAVVISGGCNVGIMTTCVAVAVVKFAVSVLITVVSGRLVVAMPTSNCPQLANNATTNKKPTRLNPSVFTIKFTRHRLYP
jgi:hypothetical protein